MPRPVPNRKHFDGRALRALREAAGLRREHLALATGRGTEAVVNWELGRAQPPGDAIVDLCQTLKCRPEDLYTDGPDEVAEVAKVAAKATRKAQGLPERSSDATLDAAAAIIRPRTRAS